VDSEFTTKQWIVLALVLIALTGVLLTAPARLRNSVMSTAGIVIAVGAVIAVIVNNLESVNFLYHQRGGLTVAWAVIVAIISAAGAWYVRSEAVIENRASFRRLSDADRSREISTIILLTGLAVIVIPMITGKITQELMANVGIFLLLALGLNIVVGLAGILDLGYVAFFAVGGYTTAVLTSENRGEDWPSWVPILDFPWGWVLALLVTIVVAALVGLMIGAPVIRMRGDYLAIVTLGFGEIIRLLFLSDWLSGFFNGAQGITNIPPADFGPFQATGVDPRSIFYLVLVFAVISIYVSWRLERSRLGRAWMAVREDESVAEAMGINTVTVKLMAFVVGAVLASFSGAIFAAKVGSIFPTSFLILVSIIILVVVIVGGMGNIVGVIVGAVVLIGVLGGPKQPGLLQEFSQYKLLIYGALLIWMMLQRPEGLVPNARRSRELHQEEFLQDAWLKGEVDHDDGTPGDGVIVDDSDGGTEVAPA
ncbi:MAG: branched-chain amino acid ABC transporter permease, partial [Acidimicrobiia bacterium]